MTAYLDEVVIQGHRLPHAMRFSAKVSVVDDRTNITSSTTIDEETLGEVLDQIIPTADGIVELMEKASPEWQRRMTRVGRDATE